ncbi:4-(cytidine 5'-diphospho)-2-C-methyl-D-erythritol kinase [Desulfovibrio porci]|uniref:4-(cytidine 5'-diphospho)-2-C-methyl-D-erythritol kinase n=1 Tax=Desulfovibrio porci TaxID=2605782 RepID=UPI002A7F7364|nr:4-(cytidine 5'-diphospho)-2-C-methyl-D-erythritol kinase [Desulfovibrio porci]MDY3810561.1 4-(cytidine 5'-diphospho)-2-C-methyl-D-erythritol kinase [Desulfovibrio porci]
MIHLTAGCKVNLGLHVVGVRADGYHELDSLFYPLPTPCDHLEIRETGRQGIVLRCDEPGVNPEHNTLTRAYAAFVKETGGAPGIAVHLRKGIPLGSGLGGGSSDAASLLLWLNQRAGLPLDAAGLARAALAVGADAPFFLYNQPCRVQGIGEILTPMDYDFSGLRLVLVCPEIHVDTAWAFARYDALFPHADRTAAQNSLTKSPCEANGTFLSGAGNATWSVWDIRNDLEAAVFPQYPQLAAIKADLLRLGADTVCMSGSGSSVLGLFNRAAAAKAEDAAAALRAEKRHVYLLPLGNTGM